MLIDSKHKPWASATAIVALATTMLYWVYAAYEPDGPRGGSLPGLLFGIAASGLMLFCGALSLRKKVPLWPIGSAQTWLRAHIWLGLLSVLWIGFHAGWRLGGRIEQGLWLVLGGIVVSGLIGLLLQQMLPRYLTSRVTLETFYDQVDHVCELLQMEADIDIAGWCGPLDVDSLPKPATTERLAECKLPGLTSVIIVYRSQSGEGEAQHVDRPLPQTKPPELQQEPLPVGTVGGNPQVKPTEVREPVAVASAPQADTPTAKPAAGMSVKEKLALMRAVKQPTVDSATPITDDAAKTPTPVAEAKPAGTMSAAEKIAAMRAKSAARKEPLAESTPAPVETPTAVPTPAATAETSEPLKPAGMLSAAEKIAAMRAKSGKQPTPPASTSTAGDVAEKPVPAVRAPTAAKETAKPARPAAARGPIAIKPVAGCELLREFYLRDVRPFLSPSASAVWLANPLRSRSLFRELRAIMSPMFQEVLDHLEAACEERRQLRQQVRIHRWLHAWMIVHLPLSWALLVLGIWHVFISLRY